MIVPHQRCRTYYKTKNKERQIGLFWVNKEATPGKSAYLLIKPLLILQVKASTRKLTGRRKLLSLPLFQSSEVLLRKNAFPVKQSQDLN